MQTQTATTETPRRAPATETENTATAAELAATAPGAIRVIRRNGKVTAFDAAKINIAMTKAFLAVEGGTAAASSARARDASKR